MTEIKTVVVVGAGTMGHGVAQLLATKGLQVHLVDVNEKALQNALTWIQDNLSYMAESGQLAAGNIKRVLNKIKHSTDIEACAPKADFVLEAVNENFELKRGLLKRLSQITSKQTILASNTSSFDINDLSIDINHVERFLGMHWFHPPQITPCVEVIPSNSTSKKYIMRALKFLEAMGKFPTVCRSSPGFVANRMQMALAAEAIAIVEEGLATPEEVDRIAKSSFGFRLSAYGPLEICDQAGIDSYLAVLEYLFKKLRRKQFAPPEILKKMVKQGRLGLKTKRGFYNYQDGFDRKLKSERDKRLHARLKLFRQEQGLERDE